MAMSSEVNVSIDMQKTLELFNRVKSAVVTYFNNRPFQKYDDNKESKIAFSLNKSTGLIKNGYNSGETVPDVRLEELEKSKGRYKVFFDSPGRTPEDHKKGIPFWMKPCRVTIAFDDMDAKVPGPRVNVRVYDPDETWGVVKLFKDLGLKPNVNDHELWSKVDVYAHLKLGKNFN